MVVLRPREVLWPEVLLPSSTECPFQFDVAPSTPPIPRDVKGTYLAVHRLKHNYPLPLTVSVFYRERADAPFLDVGCVVPRRSFTGRVTGTGTYAPLHTRANYSNFGGEVQYMEVWDETRLLNSDETERMGMRVVARGGFITVMPPPGSMGSADGAIGARPKDLVLRLDLFVDNSEKGRAPPKVTGCLESGELLCDNHLSFSLDIYQGGLMTSYNYDNKRKVVDGNSGIWGPWRQDIRVNINAPSALAITHPSPAENNREH